jgi:hypothetical protein
MMIGDQEGLQIRLRNYCAGLSLFTLLYLNCFLFRLGFLMLLVVCYFEILMLDELY